MSRRIPTNLIAVVAVAVLVALIGMVTLLASRLINETVVDQFRSQELQLVGSLSQQAETYFTSLNADITSLSLQPLIKNTTIHPDDESLDALMAEHAGKYGGVIRTIIRFDGMGLPRYGWPSDLNDELVIGGSVPYAVPRDLTDLVRQTGGEVAMEIELRQASRLGSDAGTFLLIAPVYTNVRQTEFIVYEVDLDALFAEIVGVVDLEKNEQLWVIDSLNEILFQANDVVPLRSLTEKIPLAVLSSFREATIEEYKVGDSDRLAAIAPVRSQGNKTFFVVLSRNVDTALAQVQSDLQRLFALAAGAVVLLAGLTWLVMNRLAVVARRHQEEVQRRQTARTLLEMSRALNSTLDLQDVLRNIMGELAELVPYDSAAILLLDRSKLTVAAHRGADVAEHEAAEFELDKAHAANHVLQTGHPIMINDTLVDDRWTPLSSESRIRAWMGIPLRVRDKTVGVLNINSHTAGRFSPEEIELAEAFADQASVALQNARLHEFQVKQIEQEIDIACQIQASLLPTAAPQVPQLEFAMLTLPARQVSGDYFQYLPMPNGRLGIAVGDVSGKGIPAAMLMAIITTAMRDEVARNAKPAALLDALNQRLLERMKATHVNSALLVGIFDPATRRIEIANGGMVQPYVRNGKTWEFVPVGGYPLGVSQRMSYTSKVVTLAPGAMLLMMSDGVVEAQNSAGEFYGFERLEVLLNSLSPDSSAQDVVDRIMAAVREYLEGEEPQDDLTILAIQSMEIPVTAGAAAVVVPETPVKPEKAETVPETKQAPEPAAATEKPAEAEITAKIVEAGAVGLEKTEKTTEVEVKPAAAATTAGDAPAAESKESDPKPEASPPDAAGASDSPDRTTTSASTPTTTTGSSAAATPNAAPGGTPVTPETPAEPGPAEPPEGE